MTFSPPTADQQIAFLHDLQRIFEEGDFSATYKFALLMALAAVEAGNDSGSLSTVNLILIGEKFVELYWRQAAPYSTVEGTTGVLSQNRAAQAAVIRHLNGLHSLSRGNISMARRSDKWAPTIRAVAGIIREMPLRHLQVIAGEQRQFLYEYPPAKVMRWNSKLASSTTCAGFIDDLVASKMIARWAYRQSVGGHAWVGKGQREPIDTTYLDAV